MIREKKTIGWPFSVTRKDLHIQYFRGSGPGGQHRNKRDTACRITHVPTGAVAWSEKFKSQHRNRKEAFLKLAESLSMMMVLEIQEATQNKDKEIINTRVRTYNEKSKRVVDKRLPGEVFNYNDVLCGDGLEKIINKLLKKG